MPAASATAQSSDIIAVFEIERRGVPLKAATMANLNDYMYGRLASAGFKLTPQSQVRERVVDLKRGSHKDCYDQSCQIELGKAVAADKSLSSRLIKIGDVCALQSQIYDLKTETTDAGAEAEGPCTVAGIKASIDLVVAKFKGGAVVPAPSTQDLDKGGGTAKITSSPSGAEVWLNDEFIGITPHVIPEKPSGTYKLRLELPDYVSNEATLVIKEGKETIHHRELASNWGKISVSSSPTGATVYLDDVLVPNLTTPCVLDRVTPGVHVVKFFLAGHSEGTARTSVVRGKTASVAAKLEPMRGRLVVSSSYGGGSKCEGNLKIDGLPVGRTPWQGDVSAGSHTVEVQCPKGKASQQVTVAHNSRSDVNIKIDTAGIECVRIPGGTFQMGSNDLPYSQPVYRVTVPEFEISKTAVTFKQYRACVSAGGCTPAHVDDGTCYVWTGSGFEQGTLPSSFQGDDQPVVCVDWHQAQAYAKWAGGRLPSEAEWEYAARSGGRDWKYPWGDEKATCDRAVMYDGGLGCGRKSTWPVCSKPRGNTTQGLCDMAGNVFEWVQDWWHDSYQGAPTNGSAWESPAGSIRVYRGGSWSFYARNVRSANRGSASPSYRSDVVGFRLAKDSL
ncbi:MAG TPA: SUMF1/EgtB/PvdO family nonheme iron enzyme [Myxococcota bacterium]|nr:SUMF1/EgtB/PvdO family nonheme iron enzyme [Myxococcota bacterium]HOS61862.1 SUMF1/EgtB/PvdO family nonheme iron enzyme [Myxococcota bacterium]HPL24935.1 SUMF1/EgtB/PvdO family nonheme iron enzyme [Myxococcota bacterium]